MPTFDFRYITSDILDSFKGSLYLARGSCEQISGVMQHQTAITREFYFLAIVVPKDINCGDSTEPKFMMNILT